MVGADGGNSVVRRALDLPFEGRTKPNQWIVVDVRNDPIGTPHVYLHCDPKRPYVSAALPHGIRRFEFMVMPGESEADFEDPAHMARLMRKVVADADRVDCIRKRVYTHNARLAARGTLPRRAACCSPATPRTSCRSGSARATTAGCATRPTSAGSSRWWSMASPAEACPTPTARSGATKRGS
jgi:hypothetical protein